jgi:Tfp pilus assembly protein FimT
MSEMMTTFEARKRRDAGFAILLTVLVLVILASLGLASMSTVQRDQQVAGVLNRKKMALHAADAGVAVAMQTASTTGTPSVATASLGDTGVFPYGQPSYSEDASDGDAVESLGLGGMAGMNLRVDENGTPQFQLQYWRVRVQGDAPGGSTARVEFATGALFSN